MKYVLPHSTGREKANQNAHHQTKNQKSRHKNLVGASHYARYGVNRTSVTGLDIQLLWGIQRTGRRYMQGLRLLMEFVTLGTSLSLRILNPKNLKAPVRADAFVASELTVGYISSPRMSSKRG